MKTYWAYNKKAYGLFFKNMNRFIGYRLASSIVITLLLMPFLSGVSKKLMALSGHEYLTNNLLGKFLMSPAGIMLIFISILIGFLVVLLELGGMIVLSHQAILGEKESRFIDILRYSLKRFKLLLGFDGLLIVIYFIILAPLFNNGLSASVLENIKIPGFILQTITASDLLSILFIMVATLIVILTIRWMFSLFVLMLDDQVNKKILKTSNLVRKGNMKKIIKFSLVTLLYNGLLFLLIALIYIVMSIVILIILHGILEVALVVLMAIGGLLLLLFLAIEVPVSMLASTLLYHELSGKNKPLDIHVVEGSTIVNKLLRNKVFILISLSMVIIIATGVIYFAIEAYDNIIYDVDITAHRGSSFEAPENTLSAIEIAYENGADFVEIDVQLTKDGQVILLHDETFKRTSGVNKRPDQMLLEDIQKLDGGLWFSSAFKGEVVPTLQDVMTYSKGKIKLNIEIKGSEHSPEIRSKVVDLIIDNNYLEDCVITSLLYDDIKGVELLDSRIKTGYIMFIAFGDLEKLHTDFYSIEASNVTEEFVKNAHDIGREVHVWTVNSEDEMKTMMELGVDNIITDNDKTLKKIINESAK